MILLSDTFLRTPRSRGGCPDVDSLPVIDPNFATANGEPFLPYARDEKLARPWAVPGTPGLVHRIGGLEREDGTGNISYDAENHERMTHLRQRQGRRASPTTSRRSRSTIPTGDAELLVLGWGSSLGTIRAAATARARPRVGRSRPRTCVT